MMRDHAYVIRAHALHTGYCPYPASTCECQTSNLLAALDALEAEHDELKSRLGAVEARGYLLAKALKNAIRIDRIGHMPGEQSSWVPEALAILDQKEEK